jgi:site-specific recombinase XerD
LSVKGSKTKREWNIPIVPQLEKEIISYKEHAQQIRVIENTDQMFNITKYNNRYAGNTMSEEQVSGFFKRLSKHMSTPVTPHRFRHTLATKMASGYNPDIKSIQYLFGHTNISTTLGYIEPDI